MQIRWGIAALAIGLAVLVVVPVEAQQRQRIAAPTLQPDPNLDSEDQFAPSQIRQPMPAAVAEPAAASHKHARKRATASSAVTTEPAAAAAPARPRGGAVRTVIACSGPFAKDSGMLALAMTYDSRNVIYTEETVQGATVGASVLFPKDPKRRLEVWWSNPNRTGTFLIDIAGKSTWTGPGGLRLGLTLPELEKLNRKPFRIKGFDRDGIATVSDWDGGTLGSFPGGCKSGVNLRADAKAADAVAALAADKAYSSADPEMRATKPRVSEVLIGY